MKNLIIIGAGGCGREVLQWVKDINEIKPTWIIKGFIDDDLNVLDGKKCSMSIIGTIDKYNIEPDDMFVCCIGNGVTRMKVVEKMKAKGAKFVSIIHPTAIVSDSCTLGDNIILYPYSLISDNAVIGEGTIVNMHSTIAHDSVLGQYCTISAHCDVTGSCKLGDRVFMGSCSNMVPGAKVGNDVFVCAGSTIMSRVKDGLKVLGVPAKKISI